MGTMRLLLVALFNMLYDWLIRLLTLGIGLFMLLCGGLGAIATFNNLKTSLFAPPFYPDRSGRFVAQGIVQATDSSKMVTAPLSQSPCVACKLTISESRGRSRRVFLYTKYRGQSNISLRTEYGLLSIDSCELHLERYHTSDQQHMFRLFSQEQSYSLLTQHNISANSSVGTRRSLSITESVLCEGDVVYAIGRQIWSNQKRILKSVIVTDKPIRHFIAKSIFMFTASMLIIYLSVGVIHIAFR